MQILTQGAGDPLSGTTSGMLIFPLVTFLVFIFYLVVIVMGIAFTRIEDFAYVTL